MRPNYKAEVDILGTQARYDDITATDNNFSILTESGTSTTQVWCTMCSQEWYRQVNAPLESETPYDGSQSYSSFWEGYSLYRGQA